MKAKNKFCLMLRMMARLSMIARTFSDRQRAAAAAHAAMSAGADGCRTVIASEAKPAMTMEATPRFFLRVGPGRPVWNSQ